jgi:hypothetical protein
MHHREDMSAYPPPIHFMSETIQGISVNEMRDKFNFRPTETLLNVMKAKLYIFFYKKLITSCV